VLNSLDYDKIQITLHVAALTRIDSASGIVVDIYNRMMTNQELINEVSIQKGY